MASKTQENVKPAEEAVKAADAEVKKAAPAKKAPAKKAAAPKKAPEKKAAPKKAPEKKAAAPKKAPVKAEVIIQSPMGGEITPEAVLAKVGAVDKVYIRVDVNKAYWVKGEEYGAVELW